MVSKTVFVAVSLRIMVRNCQLCGEDHEMDFVPLSNPADEYAYYGACPIKGQPMFLSVGELAERCDVESADQ